MNKIKNYLYGLGLVILIVIIFFKKDLPKAISDSTWIICSIVLGFILVLEFITRKKSEK